MLLPLLEEKSSVFTVSELNAQIKALLEGNYRFLWIKGEISNFRSPSSGHHYFTLKDEYSQIRAVMFRQQTRSLRFAPEDGLQVICQGRVSVYEPRGEYQIIIEVMEPQGVGALQLAFEQLKKRLQGEGLFDPARKKRLPTCPREIAVVTSPTGAAVRDILKVLQRSPYPLFVTLFPVRVQGQGASLDISAAIEAAHEMVEEYQWDVIIVGRGGGSMEDLWPFNEEVVARSIAACPIPTISAVGHEIDVTIADMVSDFRAPTPTGAAEWIVYQLEQFQRDLSACRDRSFQIIERKLEAHRQSLHFLEKRLVDPRRRLADLRLFVDDRLERLNRALNGHVGRLSTICVHLSERLNFTHPLKAIYRFRDLMDHERGKLDTYYRRFLNENRFHLQKSSSQLQSLSPLAVLGRGYSVTYSLPGMKVLRKSSDVNVGSDVLIRLSHGVLKCSVTSTDEEGAST